MSIDRVIRIEREGHVATVWLDRTEARNAMASAFFEELPVAMAEVSSDDAVRAVVVAARGPDFTVGLDLKTIGSTSPTPRREPPTERAGRAHPPSMATRAMRTRARILRLQKSITSVAACPKPVIAAVHGYCIGGGVDLIAACDIRLASADAIFSVRETKMAIVADLGSLQRLPAIIGKGHLAELAYTGKDITAERAEEIGLVNDVLPTPTGVPRRPPAPGRGDRGQLAPRRPGHQGGAGGQRGPAGGRGPRLRRDLERRVPGLRRPRRGHDRLHGEAAGDIHRALKGLSCAGSERHHAGAASGRAAGRFVLVLAPRRGPREPTALTMSSAWSSSCGDLVLRDVGLVLEGRLDQAPVAPTPRRPAAGGRRGSSRGTPGASGARSSTQNRATSPES